MARTSIKGQRNHGQDGAVAVSFALLIIVLLGFVGFALDVGRLYVSRAELQNAADTCALAASAALTGANANQLQVAENYGIAAGNRNLIGMQRTAAGITSAGITFSQTLNGTYQTSASISAANALNMHYARCTLSEADIPTLLIHVVNLLPGQNIGPSTVKVTAVAGLEPSKSNCALPLAVCEPDVKGKPAGTWIQGLLNPGGSINGAFKWVEFPGYTQNKDLQNLIEGSGQCDLNSAQSVGSAPGVKESITDSWNTRFGIYTPSGPSVASAPPDLTGWVYDPTTFPPQNNAMPDFLQKRAQSTPKHQSSPDYKLANPNKWATDEQFQNGQDRRLVVGPIIDCNALANNGTAAIKGWACYLMLNPVFKPGDYMYLEYRGDANDLSSGCVTSGAPGGPAAGGPKVPSLVL